MICKLRAREVSSYLLRDAELKSSSSSITKLPLSTLFPRLGSPANCVVLGFSHDGHYILSLDHSCLRIDLFVNGSETFNTRYLTLSHNHILNHHASLLHLTVQLIALPRFDLSCTLCQNDDFYHLSIFRLDALLFSEHIQHDLHSMRLWSTYTHNDGIDHIVILSGIAKIWFYGTIVPSATVLSSSSSTTGYESSVRNTCTTCFSCDTPCILSWYWNNTSVCSCPTCCAHTSHVEAACVRQACFDADAFIAVLYHHYFGSLDSSAKDFCVQVLGPDVDDCVLVVVTIAMEIYRENGVDKVLMGWVLSIAPWSGDVHVIVMYDLLYYLGISVADMWRSLEKTTHVFMSELQKREFDWPSLSSAQFESYVFRGIGRQTFSRDVFYHPYLPLLIYNDEEMRL